MYKIMVWVLSSSLLFGASSSISKITPAVKKRMIEAKSWRKGCPVPLTKLRYLKLKHLNFKGKTVLGEMVVHKDIAKEVVTIFDKLYKIGYPIRQMRLVADYQANDWVSIEADNTSAFNCRNIAGTSRWSKHAYGKAIDINPIENPYVSRSGYISHKASWKYKKRLHRNKSYADKAVLLRSDKATKIFKKYGWTWGGDWKTIKDYQHFHK